MEKEKIKAYEVVSLSWSIAKPLFDNPDSCDMWQESRDKYVSEFEKMEDAEKELFQEIIFGIWSYINLKNGENRNEKATDR